MAQEKAYVLYAWIDTQDHTVVTGEEVLPGHQTGVQHTKEGARDWLDQHKSTLEDLGYAPSKFELLELSSTDGRVGS